MRLPNPPAGVAPLLELRPDGRDRVVPYVFPTAAMLAGLPPRHPAATHGQVGLYCYDTMTLVGPGTWEAIRAAADAGKQGAHPYLAAGWPWKNGRPQFAGARTRVVNHSKEESLLF